MLCYNVLLYDFNNLVPVIAGRDSQEGLEMGGAAVEGRQTSSIVLGGPPDTLARRLSEEKDWVFDLKEVYGDATNTTRF